MLALLTPGLLSPGPAIDLRLSRMEMLNTRQGWGSEAGRVEVWFGLRSGEPLSRDSAASQPPHPPSVSSNLPVNLRLSLAASFHHFKFNQLKCDNIILTQKKMSFFRNVKSALIWLHSVKSINSGKEIEIPSLASLP